MKWYKILHRLAVVGLCIYHWIQLHRAETLKEMVLHGFDCIFWMVGIVFIYLMTVNDKRNDEPEEVDAEEVEIHEYEDL